MDREFIIVVGNQGAGKTEWTKAYVSRSQRLLVSDPLASYRVDFVTDPLKWAPAVLDKRTKTFRYGTHYPNELALFGSLAFAAGDCTFVVEECGVIFSRGEELDEWAHHLVYMGRHSRTNLVFVAQRANSIPVGVRSQASRIVSFRQTEPDDVRAIYKRLGHDSDERIPTLPDLVCLDWDNRSGELREYRIDAVSANTPGAASPAVEPEKESQNIY